MSIACLQVLYWECGVDGVELRRFTMHSCQLFVLRCKSAGLDMIGRAENCKVLMAIPGPKQPEAQQWAAYFSLMFSAFTNPRAGPSASSPQSDIDATASSQTAQTANAFLCCYVGFG
jgi:hypothetical protein